jgi:hypothetical protein
MKKLLAIVSMALLLTACSKDEDDNNRNIPTLAGRTVVVYMSGENNLSTFLNKDLAEIRKGAQLISNDNNLVVYVDHASTVEMPFIARIKNDKQNQVDTLFQFAEDFYSSSPEAFHDILNRIVNLCPAQSYGLVLWGHASGWRIEKDSVAIGNDSPLRRAYGRDRGDNKTADNGSGKWMNIPSMGMALKKLGVKWNFIFCDCCNMAGAEVAYELSDVADWLIGSPAEIPGDGAPYATLAPLFFSNSQDFYKNIVDAYAAEYPNYLPLAAIKLSEMDLLARETQRVLPMTAEQLNKAQPTKDLIYYFTDYPHQDDSRYKAMYDMKNFMKVALADHADEYMQWEKAFNNAVRYTVKSSKWQTMYNKTVEFDDFTDNYSADNQGCVSMFIPLAAYLNGPFLYNEIIKDMKWYYAVGWSDLVLNW